MSRKRTKEVSNASQNGNDENQHSSDDEDEAEQISGGNGSTILGPVREQNVNDIVRYILNCQQKGVAIKRADITKEILKNYKNNFTEFFNEACERIEKTFGAKVRELQAKRNHYILVNNLPPESAPEIESHEAAKYGLLGSVLTFLFMQNPEKTCSNEKNVLNFLRKLGVDVDRSHKTFGDVKHLLTREFVQRNYLQIQKIQTGDGHEFEWSWGERASYEFSRLNCLETYCRIYRDLVTPDGWPAHHKEATKDE